MSIIAHKCPNINVNVVDINTQRIKQWNSPDFNELPIFEPGLAEIVKKCRGKFIFSNSLEENIKRADMVLFL